MEVICCISKTKLQFLFCHKDSEGRLSEFHCKRILYTYMESEMQKTEHSISRWWILHVLSWGSPKLAMDGTGVGILNGTNRNVLNEQEDIICHKPQWCRKCILLGELCSHLLYVMLWIAWGNSLNMTFSTEPLIWLPSTICPEIVLAVFPPHCWFKMIRIWSKNVYWPLVLVNSYFWSF